MPTTIASERWTTSMPSARARWASRKRRRSGSSSPISVASRSSISTKLQPAAARASISAWRAVASAIVSEGRSTPASPPDRRRPREYGPGSACFTGREVAAAAKAQASTVRRPAQDGGPATGPAKPGQRRRPSVMSSRPADSWASTALATRASSRAPAGRDRSGSGSGGRGSPPRRVANMSESDAGEASVGQPCRDRPDEGDDPDRGHQHRRQAAALLALPEAPERSHPSGGYEEPEPEAGDEAPDVGRVIDPRYREPEEQVDEDEPAELGHDRPRPPVEDGVVDPGPGHQDADEAEDRPGGPDAVGQGEHEAR